MTGNIVTEAAELLEKANANLEPELIPIDAARELLGDYARIKKLASFGEAVLARRIDDATAVARATGTSMGHAKKTLETGAALRDAPELGDALARGEVSLDQAGEIAKAERARPGSAGELLKVAREESFHVLRDEALRVKLEADRHKGLGERQKQARSARSYNDELGMVNIHLRLQPHVGTPIVNRTEAEAGRLYREARKNGDKEQFERHLADAYAKMLSGTGKGRTTRPEFVVLVSHGVAQRGWQDVRDGEFCKIPGVGPVPPEVAKEIAQDAFLNGVFFDGVDLRHFKRWTRNIPVEIKNALELGAPPDFDGVKCVDCGNRFRPERDHVEPRNSGGPTATGNLNWRCDRCHEEKTKRDRVAGKLTPPPPDGKRRPSPDDERGPPHR
jgi:HNH endonuclease